MRLSINGEDYEVRVQQRTVTFCDIMKSGKLVSKGIAIPKPQDVAEGLISEEMGARIAAGRALKYLEGQTDGFSVKAKTNEIVAKVKNRLDRQRILDRLSASFHKSMDELDELLKFAMVPGTGFLDSVKAGLGLGPSKWTPLVGVFHDGGPYNSFDDRRYPTYGNRYPSGIESFNTKAFNLQTEAAEFSPEPYFTHDGTAPGTFPESEPVMSEADYYGITRRILGLKG